MISEGIPLRRRTTQRSSNEHPPLAILFLAIIAAVVSGTTLAFIIIAWAMGKPVWYTPPVLQKVDGVNPKHPEALQAVRFLCTTGKFSRLRETRWYLAIQSSSDWSIYEIHSGHGVFLRLGWAWYLIEGHSTGRPSPNPGTGSSVTIECAEPLLRSWRPSEALFP